MASLTVWKFEDPFGAERTIEKLEQLSKQELITIHDAAVVTWQADKKKPKTRHLANMTGSGALGGAFWGMLFGLIFFIPLIGLAVGAAAGALSGSLINVGIDKDFIDSARERITPGTSALFLLSSDAVVDRIAGEFKGAGAELIQTNLSSEQEQALRETFSEEG